MKYILISYLLATSVAVCNNKNNSSTTTVDSTQIGTNGTDSTKNETLAGKWYLLPVLPSDTASGKTPVLDFDLNANTFSGNTGCNSMSGSFTQSSDGLAFNKNIISTKMACLGYNENVFLDNLLKTNRFTIKNGKLQLMFNTTVLSNWSRNMDTLSTKHI